MLPTSSKDSQQLTSTLSTGRSLTLCFVRNSVEDEETDRIRFSGYDILWPDGQRVDVGLSRFCQFGVRTLFGRRSAARNLVTIHMLPLLDREAPLPKLPRGIRNRRFCLHRSGEEGRVLLIDGSPTELVFHLKDDERVVHWIRLREIPDGGEQWYDVVVIPVEEPTPVNGRKKEEG